MTLAVMHRAPAAMPALGALLLALGAPAIAAPTAAERTVAAAERRVARAPSPDALVGLAGAFMQTARETGDPAYYERAGAALERALAAAPDHDGARRARAWVELGRHQFRRALRTARDVRRLHPEDWFNYGNLADACIELGYYRGAGHAVARMMALRPGVAAYTRVAALRALFGDRRGAIEALRVALGAVDPADAEERAWVLTYLGHEHRALGDLARAAECYQAALEAFPDYHLALPALAAVRAAQGRPDEAAPLYERALALAPTPATAGALGDLHAATGHPERARASYDFAMYMGRVASARGQSAGRELALFLADHDRDLDAALHLARAEAARRDDVYTDDALAWTLFKHGELAAAKRASMRALRLGTEEAAFHRHAGRIAEALGRPRSAARHRRAATALTGAS